MSTKVIVLLCVISILGQINHIDDTDEVFGYWEPLHYLMFGNGMQTWEYSPAYAIRSYVFLLPMWAAGELVKYFGFSKVQIFYFLRTLIGIFSVYCQQRLVNTLKIVSPSIGSIAGCSYFLSAGTLFCSTSFLPSALCMNLFSLSIANYLSRNHLYCIFCGSIAVLCCGWPFVGLIFLPLGIHMLLREFQSSTSGVSVVKLCSFCFVASLIVGGIASVTISIDSYFYQKWCFPAWNILKYNAMGGDGDILYGVESAIYYVKNLSIMMGPMWALCCVSPAAIISHYRLHGDTEENISDASKGASVQVKKDDGVYISLFFCAVCWLGVLFSRPHKEERFLYPSYPVIIILSALVMDQVLQLIQYVYLALNIKSRIWFNMVKYGYLLVCGVIAVARIWSNYKNFGGYMQLWSSVSTSNSNTVCVGSDWYTFPSSFFLPNDARLEFLQDNFGGQLPQHFREVNHSSLQIDSWNDFAKYFIGTYAEPLQAFNNLNAEETSRYVDVYSCDIIITTEENAITENDYLDRRWSVNDADDTGINQRPVLSFLTLQYQRHKELSSGGDELEQPSENAIESQRMRRTNYRSQLNTQFWFERTEFKPVIHPTLSPALPRAFYIPYYSNKKNQYRRYSVYRKLK